MDSNIAYKLKELRKSSNESINDVCLYLKECGFDISTKTMYSYESGYRMPNADIFLALCVHYGCIDILFDFGYTQQKMHSPLLSSEEQELLNKYNQLQTEGKDMIRGALGLEKIKPSTAKREIAKMA